MAIKMKILRIKKAQAPLEIRHRRCMSYRRQGSLTGQALLELAIFGSILIMLLGIILNYGLRFNFEQKTQMSAFRKALEMSANDATGNQGNLTLVTDKHIPNPSNPFAVGSVMPFMSSANVVRNYKMQETADTPDELPQTTFQIQDRQYTYKTAGFRDETITSGLDKYKEIYGDSNVWEEPKGSGIYRIIDSCEGEIIGFDSCKRQCRQITEVTFCVRECERGKEPGSSKDCNAICDEQIASPWYCAPGVLEDIFNFAIAQNKRKAMGIQSDYTKDTAMRNSLRKEESGGVITTTDTIDWADTTTRTVVYNQRILNPEGTVQPGINIQQVPVATTIGETATLNCQDGVCK